MSPRTTQIRRARSRLTDMAVQEVSLVDQAANLRRFVITKRDGMAAQQKNAGATNKALQLPTAAKQGLMDGLAQVLDNLTGVAQAIGEAEINDQAPVPQELGMALNQCAEVIEGMADQYGVPAAPEQTPPDEHAPPPEPTATAPQKAGGKSPPPPNSGGAAASDNPVGSMAAHKADETKPMPTAGIPGASMPSNGSALGTPPIPDPPGSNVAGAEEPIGEMLLKSVAGLNSIIVKAGRKIAGHRFSRLANARDELNKIIDELAFDKADDMDGGNPPPPAAAPAPGKPPPPKKPAAAPPFPPPAEKGFDASAVADAIKAAVDKALAPMQKRLAESDMALAELRKSTGVPAAANAGEGDPAPKREIWPADMSAAIAKRKEEKSR